MVFEYSSVLYLVENVRVLFLLATFGPSPFSGQVRSKLERGSPPLRF